MPLDRRRKLVLWISVALPTLAVAWLTFAFSEPPPPKHVTLATGVPGGAYVGFGAELAQLVSEDHGPKVALRRTGGSADNLRLLVAGEVDVAFVQSGTVSALAGSLDTRGLRAIASIYSEPLWVFYRSASEMTLLRELRASPGQARRRVAIGQDGSGTSLIAVQLLAANGVTAENAELVRLPPDDAIAAFRAGNLDAIFLIGSPDAASVQALLHVPDARLMNFVNYRAYARRLPYLQAIELDQGLLSLEENIPSRALVLLAPSATLVTRESVHPRIVELFTKAAVRRFTAGNMLDPAGAFPSVTGLELPQHAAARRFLTDGESWASRHLPFWFLRLLARLKLVLIPAATIVLTSARFIPLLLKVRVSRLLRYKYEALRKVEDGLRAARTPAEVDVCLDENRRLREHVAEFTRDLAGRYQPMVYHFQVHARLVHQEGEEKKARLVAEGARV